jgi:hypothetical protein
MRKQSIFEKRNQEGLKNNKPNITNNVLDNAGAQIRDVISPGRIIFLPRRLTLDVARQNNISGLSVWDLLLVNLQTS